MAGTGGQGPQAVWALLRLTLPFVEGLTRGPLPLWRVPAGGAATGRLTESTVPAAVLVWLGREMVCSALGRVGSDVRR